jgi:alkanesulfonate monooxygenase SsuD/methylene tetrahydromethanopterin reductase-like flavin-dependent oxidoreductase (luciferase family)
MNETKNKQKLRFGVILLQDSPWSNLVKLFQKVETLGFDSAWIADHYVNYANPAGPWLDGWTSLAALANCTSKIRIGTLVTSIPFRHPAVLARQAMTVDHVSNGRLELGIGAGSPGKIDPSYAMTGIADWPFKERTERFREYVAVVDTLLRNPKSTYDGNYYHLNDAIMAPTPLQKPRPPLVIAGHVKASLRTAAEFADTWVSFGADFGAPHEIVAQKTQDRIAYLEKYCEKIGRDPLSIRRALLIFGAEANTAFASEGKFIEIVERYTALGITDFVFYYPFFAPDQIPTFEQIAKTTIPSLR